MPDDGYTTPLIGLEAATPRAQEALRVRARAVDLAKRSRRGTSVYGGGDGGVD